MTDPSPLDPPSPFIDRWVSIVARDARWPARALDVAMGRGRHARLMGLAGFATFGVDVKFDAVRAAVKGLADVGVPLRAWCADLTMAPLPATRFALIVVTRYLQRDLLPSLADALVPGGVLLYETFTERQRAHGRGPTSADHLLQPGELAAAFATLETLFYEEIEAPDAVARLAARRRSRFS
jgi:tellurite methyltransferase